MEILAGLMDHQVLQRNRKNVCESVLVGKTDIAGEVTACVAIKGKPLAGWKGKKLANVKAGEFECVLTGIPVGGPYTISLRVGKTGELTFKDILVGDVWILGGQSNMHGYGESSGAAKPHSQVRAFYMNDRWGMAKDPIHNIWQAVDPVHEGYGEARGLGTGPGVAFGKRMAELSGIPQGLIACAHGGSSMDQWSPDMKDRSGKTLYSATLRRVWKNGGHVAGVIWYQGCSDTAEEVYAAYTDVMKRLVLELRKDLKNPALPFIAVQLATFFSSVLMSKDIWRATVVGWNSIREQQRLLPKRIKQFAMVPAIDLPLNDPIHLNGEGQNRLGGRLAEAAWTLMGGKHAQKPPIALKSVNLLGIIGWAKIEVTYDNVMGSLQAQGRPAGFSLVTREGTPAHLIFRVDLLGNKAILYTDLNTTQGCDLDLYYGYSAAAYCNITDAGGRSVPAFGPIPVNKEDGLWNVLSVRRTPLLPGAEKLHRVCCPDPNDSSLQWKDQSFPTPFLDLHTEIEPNKDDKMLFYHLPFQCDEAMKLQIGLGYDGPIRAWLDKVEILFDPKGTNPMVFDQKKIKVEASAGRHDLVIAFSTNFGMAWGIGLKIYRKDVPPAILEKGKEFYKMPHPIE
jgi:hypothetical protein